MERSQPKTQSINRPSLCLVRLLPLSREVCGGHRISGSEELSHGPQILASFSSSWDTHPFHLVRGPL